MSIQFGSYTLLERIGSNSNCETFLAQMSGIEGFAKDIIIKRIKPHLSNKIELVNMFLAEAKLAAYLSHPNIVQIYDLGKIEGSYFIAMEYVPGRNLSTMISKAEKNGIPIPLEYVLKIGAQACEALHYAHNKTDPLGVPLNIVHRHINPDNIRISWAGTLKLLEFGMSKPDEHPAGLYSSKSNNAEKSILPLASYFSPEQICHKEIDRRSDIFSLGLILYECLTGVKLFSTEHDPQWLTAPNIKQTIMQTHIYAPSYFIGPLPEAVEKIIMRALELDYKKRYQNVLEMQTDIENFFAKHEFKPSNVHLANFLKQLFNDELTAEQDRFAKARNSLKSDEKSPSPLLENYDKTKAHKLITSAPPKSAGRVPPPSPIARGEATLEQNPKKGLNYENNLPNLNDLCPSKETYEVKKELAVNSGAKNLDTELTKTPELVKDRVYQATSSSLIINLPTAENMKIKHLAQKLNSTPDDLAKDIILHYLKYQ